MQRHRDEGTIEPRKIGGHLRPALEPHYDRIRALVKATPDITIDELRNVLPTKASWPAGRRSRDDFAR